MARSLAAAGDLSAGIGVMIGPFVPTTVLPVMTDLPDAPRRPQPDSLGNGSAESSFDLLLRAKHGDHDARERLCSRYLPRLKRWAHGRLPASSRGLLDTEDLAQEVLFHAVERIGTFQPRHEGAFPAYVRQMLKNRIRDEVRKGRRRPAAAPLGDNHAANDPSPLDMAIGEEKLERYDAALARLKPQDREIIVARVEFGFSAAELATECGRPSPEAAQMAVTRALVRLAREMTRA